MQVKRLLVKIRQHGLRYYIVVVLCLVALLHIMQHMYPRIYFYGFFVNDEESYIKAQKECSKYKCELDRDYCRMYITERYLGKE